jgi:hypothetical protein
LQFDFILFGQAIELHPFAIFAVSQMAEQGLGFKRIPFRLERVFWQVASDKLQVLSGQENEEEWRLLYDGATKRLLATPTPQLQNPDSLSIALKENRSELPDRQTGKLANQLTLAFATPTRLKFNRNLTIDFTFRMLVFKMLRRVLELAHFHVPNATIDWEFHPLLVAADDVKIAHRDLRWVDWERRSNRQKTEMMMGGFVGEMVLEGDLTPFEELLRICEVVHVGKGCVFGNGKIVCFANSPRAEARG